LYVGQLDERALQATALYLGGIRESLPRHEP
jgi:hypothetical protein